MKLYVFEIMAGLSLFMFGFISGMYSSFMFGQWYFPSTMSIVLGVSILIIADYFEKEKFKLLNNIVKQTGEKHGKN